MKLDMPTVLGYGITFTAAILLGVTIDFARREPHPWTLEAAHDSSGAVCFAYTRGTDIKPAGCLWTLDRPAQ